MKTSIPTSVLPTQLSDPNKLSTTYTTNVLIPKLGPSAVNEYIRLGGLLIRDLASAVALVEKVKDYSKEFGAPVTVVRQPDEWLRDNVVFKPTLVTGDEYSRVFSAGLSAFNNAEVVDKVKLTNAETPTRDRENAAIQQKKAYRLGNIMHGFSQPNPVVADLLRAKVINTEGDLLKNELLNADDVAAQVVKELQQGANVPEERMEEVGQLIDNSLYLLENAGLQQNTFIKTYKKDADLRKLVKRYVIDKFNGIEISGDFGFPRPAAVVSHLREWAFQRTERMDLLMGTPELRGPYSAESVTPNSNLTISESLLTQQFDFSEVQTGSVRQESSERAVFTSASFKSALSNMTESGISDDNSFSTDATLLNTLREQKRAAVDRTLSSISSENEKRSVSGSRSTSSTSRTYTTRGKDPKLATTELAFQVASKVDVEVHLENVDLVWAPYVYSPFLYTHRIIRNFKETSIFEYIEQNNVVDPVRPLEEYELGTFKKEIGIRGRENSQTKSFNFPIPAQYVGEGWELDRAGTTINFRNGTTDDYNWDEALNWDDLENWDVYIKSLAATTTRITGEATLETTDPEYFNRGFLVFNIQMRRLSERSRADLRAYAAEQMSAESERRAVFSRARQYGELRKEELITRYAQSLDLQEEAFTALVKKVFVGMPPQNLSYHKEIIRTCINWNNVTMQFDQNRATNLPFAEYSRSHFMNAPGIRFILPILRTAEDLFVDTIQKNGVTYYRTAIAEVKSYTDDYRARIEEFRASDPAKLILDQYSREIILGRHFEAVLSNHPFAE